VIGFGQGLQGFSGHSRDGGAPATARQRPANEDVQNLVSPSRPGVACNFSREQTDKKGVLGSASMCGPEPLEENLEPEGLGSPSRRTKGPPWRGLKAGGIGAACPLPVV